MSISNLKNPTSIKPSNDDWTIIGSDDLNTEETINLSTENVIKMDVGSFGSDAKPTKGVDLSPSSSVNILSKLAQEHDADDNLQYVSPKTIRGLNFEGYDDPNDITYLPQNPSTIVELKQSLASKAFSSVVSLVGKIGKGIIVDIPVAAFKFLASIPGKVQFALLEQEKKAIAENYKDLNQMLKSLYNRQVIQADEEKLSKIGEKLDILKEKMGMMDVLHEDDDKKGLAQSAINKAEIVKADFEDIKKELKGIEGRSAEIDVEVVPFPKEWGDIKIDVVKVGDSDIKQQKLPSKFTLKEPTSGELKLENPDDKELELEYIDPHKPTLQT
jgi:hypothetical protein